MSFKLLFTLSCFVCLFGSNVSDCLGQKSDLDYRENITKLIKLPIPQEAEHINDELRKIGQPAIAILVDVIDTSREVSFTKKIFLMESVEKLLSNSSDYNVISKLLDNQIPHIRGRALNFVALMKDRNALSKIIELLDDKEVFQTSIQTDPYVEKDLLISDLALNALSEIAGVSPEENLDKSEKITFWKHWWNSHSSVHKIEVKGVIFARPISANTPGKGLGDDDPCDFSKYEPTRISHFLASTLKEVKPVYPSLAKTVNAEGRVIVQILVNRKGDVVKTCVLEGHPLLRTTSLEAAKGWKFKRDFGLTPKFKPKTQLIEAELTFNFKLFTKANNTDVASNN